MVDFKKKFYPCLWAQYDDVLKGKLLLVPNNEALEIFENDYRKMRAMIFGVVPEFNDIVKELKEFETTINNWIISNGSNLVIQEEVIC